MNDIDDPALQDLRATGEAIAAATASPWQPGCVARAFASVRGPGGLVLTMQGWIDLEAGRSPLLGGGVPGTVAELEAAFAVFGLDLAKSSPEDAVLIVGAMREAVAEGFAMALPMCPPEMGTEVEGDDGFGSWLPIFAALVTQCGLGPQAALELPAGRAFALLAAHRRNQGWRVAGVPYGLRGLEERAEVQDSRSKSGGDFGDSENVVAAEAATRSQTSNAQQTAASGAGMDAVTPEVSTINDQSSTRP